MYSNSYFKCTIIIHMHPYIILLALFFFLHHTNQHKHLADFNSTREAHLNRPARLLLCGPIHSLKSTELTLHFNFHFDKIFNFRLNTRIEDLEHIITKSPYYLSYLLQPLNIYIFFVKNSEKYNT